MESVPATPDNQKIERILSDILVKLERIEEKLDEAVYPPESAIKPAYIKKIKEIDAGLAQDDIMVLDNKVKAGSQKHYKGKASHAGRKTDLSR